MSDALPSYLDKIRLFRRNARLYLLSLIISSVGLSVYALLFNFYVLSLGYDELLLGRLLTAHSTATFLGALPAGYVADRVGRKLSLLASGLATGLAIAGLVIWPSVQGLLVLSVVMGLAQSLGAVTVAPFLMENSGKEERTYLFSASFSLQMIVGMVGFWLGGRLSGWLGGASEPAASSFVYSWAMVTVGATVLLALVPLLFLPSAGTTIRSRSSALAPLRYARRQPLLLTRFVLPVLVTALASGLFVPFMNIFFRNRHQVDDAAIGTLFAAGSLVMGLGFMLAPPLADRYGKVRLVILTQLLFIPALALLGFAPWLWLSAAAYLVRVVLMTMDDPIYQAFVMEQVEEEARATVASLLAMAGSLGWAVGPALSGWLQVGYGFTPIFLVVILLYVVAVALTWRFFVWRKPAAAALAGA